MNSRPSLATTPTFITEFESALLAAERQVTSWPEVDLFPQFTEPGTAVSATAAAYHVFPQFADGRLPDGTYYRTTLMITNTSMTSATACELQLRGLTVPGFQGTYTLGPDGWIIAPTAGSQAFKSGYATLHCSAAVEAQLLYAFYGSDGTKLSEATVFSSPPASTLRILADEREGSEVGLAIANDSDSSMMYTVSAVGISSGVSLTLGPRSSVARFVKELIPGLPPGMLTEIQVSSDTGKASIVGLRFTRSVFTTIPQSVRSETASTAASYQVFPQVANGRFTDGTSYRTGFMYLNSSTTLPRGCATRLRGFNPAPELISLVLSTSGFDTHSTSGAGAFQSGYSTLVCSGRVDAQALYSFYGADGTKLSEATVFSSPSAHRAKILADFREGARVGISMANDSDLDNTYTIAVYGANGEKVGSTDLSILARTSISKFVDELVPLAANFYGQVIASSTSGTVSVIGLRFTGSVFTTIPETIY